MKTKLNITSLATFFLPRKKENFSAQFPQKSFLYKHSTALAISFYHSGKVN